MSSGPKGDPNENSTGRLGTLNTLLENNPLREELEAEGGEMEIKLPDPGICLYAYIRGGFGNLDIVFEEPFGDGFYTVSFKIDPGTGKVLGKSTVLWLSSNAVQDVSTEFREYISEEEIAAIKDSQRASVAKAFNLVMNLPGMREHEEQHFENTPPPSYVTMPLDEINEEYLDGLLRKGLGYVEKDTEADS